MLGAIARRLFGTANERFLKTLQPNVDAINAMESELEALSDDALRARLADVRGLSSWRISTEIPHLSRGQFWMATDQAAAF